jgi:DNA-binding transcriptional regulator YiaG
MSDESGSVVGVVAEILNLTSGSGEELAAQVGVSYASLYAWSRGRRRPTQRNARALAEVARQRAQRLSHLAETLDSWELDQNSPAVPGELSLTPSLPSGVQPAAVPPARPG